MSASKSVSVKNLVKIFESSGGKKVAAVDNVSLTIEPGEFVTLLGPSGCGKTTILRMLAGFEKPSEGQIFFQGTDITDLPPNERKINTVFQKYALFPHLNIYDNISFGLKEKFQKEVDRRWGNLLYKCDR